jgi:subfamily B ATP-binding cassette protein MsbA
MKAWLKLLLELFRNLNQLRPYIRANRWLVLAVVVTATGSALFEGIGIGLLIPLLGMLSGNPEGVLKGLTQGRLLHLLLPGGLPDWLWGHPATWYIAGFCTLVFGAVALKNVLLYGNQRLMAAFSRRVSMNLRAALFYHLQRATLAVFEQRKSGEIGHAYSVEATRAQNAVENVITLVQRIVLALFYLALVLFLSWQFTLGMFLLIGAIGLFTSRLHLRLRGRGDERTQMQRELFGFVTSCFNGIRVIRATNALKQVNEEFDRRNWQFAEVDRRGTLLSNALIPLSETMAIAGAMGLLVLAYKFLIQRNLLSATELMAIGFVMIRTLPLVNQIYGVFGVLTFNSAGIREALRWLQSPTFPGRRFGPTTFTSLQRGIQIEGLGYTFPNGTVALADINLEIPAGKTVALVGASGSGKTTLASLLLRLREPTSGRIMVDGLDYWEFTSESWHARLGMVEQEAFLFNDTVVNNIRFGCPDATPDRLQKAVKMAHLDDVIRHLPDGLETTVGERGTMLSGGQKQRLAIARAMVRDPQLLILDEATSALDNYSERQVQAALDQARQGRTSVVIAHRLTTIRNADLIVVLDRGRVVERGGWDELKDRGGAFSRLLAAAEQGRLAEA